jgi:hypothetical protein
MYRKLSEGGTHRPRSRWAPRASCVGRPIGRVGGRTPLLPGAAKTHKFTQPGAPHRLHHPRHHVVVAPPPSTCPAVSDPRRNPRVSDDLRQDRPGVALPIFRQDHHAAVVLTNRSLYFDSNSLEREGADAIKPYVCNTLESPRKR